MKMSAAEAPLATARRTTWSAVSFRASLIEKSFLGSTHGNLANLYRWQTHGNGHHLAFLPADSDALIELEIVPHHCDISQYSRTVSNQGCSLHRRGDLAIFDEVGFAGTEYKLTAGDIDLSATKSHGVESALHGPDNVFRCGFTGHHEGVCHAWNGDIVIPLPPSVPGEGSLHEFRTEMILE